MSYRTYAVPAAACVISAFAAQLMRVVDDNGDRLVCNFPKEYSQRTYDFYIFSIGSLVCFAVVHLVRIFGLNPAVEQFLDVRRVMIASCTITVIQTATTTADYFNTRGCMDSLG